jgi:hypothetical protein
MRCFSNAQRPFSGGTVTSFAGNPPVTGTSVRGIGTLLVLWKCVPEAVQAEEAFLHVLEDLA